jgi:hypothetical protein
LRLTFPILLRRQWEVSRDYAMFATLVAYLIDAEGISAADVAAGLEPILALLSRATIPANGKAKPSRGSKPVPARGT